MIWGENYENDVQKLLWLTVCTFIYTYLNKLASFKCNAFSLNSTEYIAVFIVIVTSSNYFSAKAPSNPLLNLLFKIVCRYRKRRKRHS